MTAPALESQRWHPPALGTTAIDAIYLAGLIGSHMYLLAKVGRDFVNDVAVKATVVILVQAWRRRG